jgi:hypothetical protein
MCYEDYNFLSLAWKGENMEDNCILCASERDCHTSICTFRIINFKPQRRLTPTAEDNICCRDSKKCFAGSNYRKRLPNEEEKNCSLNLPVRFFKGDEKANTYSRDEKGSLGLGEASVNGDGWQMVEGNE